MAVKVAEETSATLRAQHDKAMDKAIRAGRILMRRPGVVIPDDIRADVNATTESSSRPSSSVLLRKMSKNRKTLHASSAWLMRSNV